MMIASVHIPKLAIAIARRDNPTLADRPLVLYTMKGKRTVVAVASDDAGFGRRHAAPPRERSLPARAGSSR